MACRTSMQEARRLAWARICRVKDKWITAHFAVREGHPGDLHEDHGLRSQELCERVWVKETQMVERASAHIVGRGCATKASDPFLMKFPNQAGGGVVAPAAVTGEVRRPSPPLPGCAGWTYLTREPMAPPVGFQTQ